MPPLHIAEVWDGSRVFTSQNTCKALTSAQLLTKKKPKQNPASVPTDWGKSGKWEVAFPPCPPLPSSNSLLCHLVLFKNLKTEMFIVNTSHAATVPITVMGR